MQSGWSWHFPCYRTPATAVGVFDWYDLHVVPAWNPHQQGYPDDLGLLVATVVTDGGGEVKTGVAPSSLPPE